MDWIQIETKWAAMACRVRADVQFARVDRATALPDRMFKTNPGRNIVADRTVTDGAQNAQAGDAELTI